MVVDILMKLRTRRQDNNLPGLRGCAAARMAAQPKKKLLNWPDSTQHLTQGPAELADIYDFQLRPLIFL